MTDNGVSGATLALVAAQAVVQVLLLALGGVALQRAGKLSGPQRGALQTVAFFVLLPALNFNGVLEAIAGANAGNMIAILVLFSLYMHLIGAAAGAVAGRLVVKQGDEFGKVHMVMATAFGNNNALPLIVYPSVLMQGVLGRQDDYASDIRRGAGLMALYNIPSAMLLWSAGIAVLRHAAPTFTSAEMVDVPRIAPPPAVAVGRHASWMLDRLPEAARPVLERIIATAVAILSPPVVGALAALFVGALPPLRRLFVDRRSSVQPSLEAVVQFVDIVALNSSTVLLWAAESGWTACGVGANDSSLPRCGPAIVIAGASDAAGAPVLLSTSAAPNVAPLSATLMAALALLASSSAPVLAICIGSNISEAFSLWRERRRMEKVAAPPQPPLQAAPSSRGLVVHDDRDAATADVIGGSVRVIGSDTSSTIRWQLLAAVVISRLVIVPACGLVTVVALILWGVIPAADTSLIFILLLECASPPAMNLQIVAEMSGRGGREMAVMIAVTYLSAIATLTIWISVFLTIMSQLNSGWGGLWV